MFRSIAAIVLEKEVLADGALRLKLFSHTEGKLLCIYKPNRRSEPIEAPSLYSFEGVFKSRILFSAKSHTLLEPFFEEHHIKLHLFCLPFLDFYPYAEPSIFTFGRYLHALRRSKSHEEARGMALWFASSILFREGFLAPEPWLKELITTGKTKTSEKQIWQFIKKGVMALEGKG